MNNYPATLLSLPVVATIRDSQLHFAVLFCLFCFSFSVVLSFYFVCLVFWFFFFFLLLQLQVYVCSYRRVHFAVRTLLFQLQRQVAVLHKASSAQNPELSRSPCFQPRIYQNIALHAPVPGVSRVLPSLFIQLGSISF